VADSATVLKTVYISVSVIRHPALGTATAKYARTAEIRSERKEVYETRGGMAGNVDDNVARPIIRASKKDGFIIYWTLDVSISHYGTVTMKSRFMKDDVSHRLSTVN